MGKNVKRGAEAGYGNHHLMAKCVCYVLDGGEIPNGATNVLRGMCCARGNDPSGKRSGSNWTGDWSERSKTTSVGRYQIDGYMSPCVHVTKDFRQRKDGESMKRLNVNGPSQNRWGRVS